MRKIESVSEACEQLERVYKFTRAIIESEEEKGLHPDRGWASGDYHDGCACDLCKACGMASDAPDHIRKWEKANKAKAKAESLAKEGAA